MNLYLLTVENLNHKFYVLALDPTEAEKILTDKLRAYYDDVYYVLNIQLLAKSGEDYINELHSLFITDNVIITNKN